MYIFLLQWHIPKMKRKFEEKKEAPDGLVYWNDLLVPETCDFEVFPLNLQNKHERDTRIIFRASDHSYFIDGKLGEYTSVTTVIERQFPAFDADSVARTMIKNKAFVNGHKKYSKYFQMKDECGPDERLLLERIKTSWVTEGLQEAAKGTSLHRDIELFYNDQEQPNTSVEYGYFKNYDQHVKTNFNFKPFRTEFKVFGEEEHICGCVDMLYVDEQGRYRLRDWKRSKKINYFGFGKFGNGLLSSLQSCNFQKYSLQLNLYKFLIEKYYGMKIYDMAIVIFHPSNNSFNEIVIVSNEQNLKALLKMQDLWALYHE